MPTISASAAWRLGIAAYGLASAPTRPCEWLTPSTKPKLGNIHGGAVGTNDVADEPDHVREQDRVPEARELLVAAQVDPQQRQPDDRELGVPVRPGGCRQQEVRRVGDALGRLLEEVAA